MKKILIVDDEEGLREAVRDLLEDAGYDCVEAENGEEAIRKALDFIPDLILCDIRMPGLDGYEVLETLSQHPTTNQIPFIFLTAQSGRDDMRKGMKLGADDFVAKPCSGDELLGSIEARFRKLDSLQKMHKEALKEAEEKLASQMYYDELTGLPNKLMFDRRCKEVLQVGERGYGVAVLIINIDHLRNINEAVGREGGDFVIQEIVDRIRQCMRKEDSLFRGESGRFISLIAGLKDEAEAEGFINRVFKKMTKPFQYQDHQLYVRLSIGSSYYSQENRNIFDVMDQAESAMHEARFGKGEGFKLYRPEMKKEAVDSLRLESDLHHAVNAHQFLVYYQPQVAVDTDMIVGAEALIRWEHPQFGMVPPISFITAAEENGLILPIGDWVLEQACLKVREWQEIFNTPFRISVNVSGRQMEIDDFSKRVGEILKKTKFSPEALELEITESLLMQNPEATVEHLQRLKEEGVSIAIDDFGTGYSSLNYLRQFPVDTLKIDRSFIRDIHKDPTGREIVSTIISMSHTLKLQVVAEGVETEEQLACLKEIGCDIYQGYFFSKPIPEEEFIQLLSQKKTR